MVNWVLQRLQVAQIRMMSRIVQFTNRRGTWSTCDLHIETYAVVFHEAQGAAEILIDVVNSTNHVIFQAVALKNIIWDELQLTTRL